MAEPLSEEVFDAAMARGGFADLSPEEREGIRQATAFAAGFAARIRNADPQPYGLEPATRFAALDAST